MSTHEKLENDVEADTLIVQWHAKRGLLTEQSDEKVSEPPVGKEPSRPKQEAFDDDDALLALTQSLLSKSTVDVQGAMGAALDIAKEASTDHADGLALQDKDAEEQSKTRTAASNNNALLAATCASSESTFDTFPEHPAQITKEIAAARSMMTTRMRKRRQKLVSLLFVTVILPVSAVFTYIENFATPIFEARAVIAISQPNNSAASGGSGVLGVLGGSPGLSQTFQADEYIRSEALVHDLLSAKNVKKLVEAGVAPENLASQLYGVELIESAIDIQAGLLTIYARLPEADQAVALNNLVIDLVSEHVNDLGEQLRGQRLGVARRSVDEAQSDLQQARQDLVQLQIDTGEIDPTQRVGATYSRIAEIEKEVSDLEAQIGRSEIAGESTRYEKQRLQILIEQLTVQADEARHSLVASEAGTQSLNEKLMEFELASQNVKISEEMLSSALSAWSQAQVEVALERSVMQLVVPALMPKAPVYPRLFANLLLAALIGLAMFFTLRMAIMNTE